MKKIALAIAVLLVLVASISCETTPKCEKENLGTVTVTNKTGFLLMVDCVYARDPEISDGAYILQPGQSVSWNRKPGYQLMMTAAVYYETGSPVHGPESGHLYTLNQCETYSCSWILYSENIPVIE